MPLVKFTNLSKITGAIRFGPSLDAPAPDPEVPYVVGGNVSVSGESPSGTDLAYLAGPGTGTPTNGKIWTFSAWVKRAMTSGSAIQCVVSTTTSNYIGFSGTEAHVEFNDSTPDTELNTDPNIYDATDWMHYVVAVDTTQAVASDRVKIWLNNFEPSDFDTEDYPNQNEEFFNVSGKTHLIGTGSAFNNGGFNGNISEVIFVDGQALTPSSFATQDSTFGWTPIEYTGTFGNNGYHLEFLDANLGLDTSGNGNSFTNNGATTTADSPTSNYPTIDYRTGVGIWKHTTGYLSTNNNDPNFPTSAWRGVRLTSAYDTGKWYWEVEFDSTVNPQMYCGVAASNGHFLYSCDNHDGDYPASGFRSVDEENTYAIGRDNVLGYVYGSNGSTTSFSPSTDPSSKFMFAVDADAKKIWIGQNGTWIGGGNPAAGTGETYTYTGDYVQPFCQSLDIPADMGLTFVVEEIKHNYTMPSGFKDLAESNKALPAATDQADYFGTLQWTGNGASSRTLTGLNFTPDFIILKIISSASYFPDAVTLVWDSETNMVFSCSSLAGQRVGDDNATIQYGTVTSAANGITVSNGSTDGRNVNDSGEDYVAYCFKKKAGFFDIVVYDDNNAQPIGELTILHDLEAKPGFMVVRSTDEETDWHVYHSHLGGASNVMKFNEDENPFVTGTWDSTEPDANSFTVGDDGDPVGPGNGVNNEHVCYLFGDGSGAGKDYVKTGKIYGNNNAILYGTFVYTGFRPAFVLFKTDDNTTVGSFNDEWYAFSEETQPIGNLKGYIRGTAISNDSDLANSSAAEIAITSNGFYFKYPEDIDASMIWVAVAADSERGSRAHLPGWGDNLTSS